ncbi:MAG: hypothetical protein ACOZFS_09995 [Thermodesulfobacteriota bacterium]
MGTKVWGMVLAIIMGLGSVNMVRAADWSFIPTITQRSEFNSNLYYAPSNPISDYILSLKPEADFNYTTEITQLQGRLGLLGMHYITHDNLDHIDQNYEINGRYQATPKIGLSLNSSYINDTTLIQELLTSGLVIGRTQRQSFYVGPGVTYNLTERLSATGSYSFNRVLYQAPQYTNYTDHQAGLKFAYLLKNEKTTLISNNIVRETLYGGGNNYKSIGIYVGLLHKFSERFDVNVLSGANINFYSFNTQVLDFSQFPYFVRIKTQRLNSNGVTPYVGASASYRWTNLSLTGGASIDQTPSAYGAIYQVSRVFATLNYDFTERLSGFVSGSFSLSNQSSQILASEYNYYNVSPGLTYQITEKFSTSAGYNYGTSSSLTDTGGSAHNHVAYIQFSYKYPIHYQK